MIHASVSRAMNRITQFAQDIRQSFGRLQSDESGISAVEFALLLPLMMTLYLGSVEISQAISADRKVTLTSRTVADLVSQVSSINGSGITDVLTASSSVMSPFTTTTLKVTVSSVSVDANNKATVDWSCTLNGTVHSKGSTVTLPSALNIANSTLIWSEVSYIYTPAIGYVLTGPLTLKDQLYMAPRISNTVSGPTSC
jgi:Flp pilus assembly protein TadG